MTTLAEQPLDAKREVALFKMMDQLGELEAAGQRTLPVGDVQSMLQDLCFELRCRWEDLPPVLEHLHDEVRERLYNTARGTTGFITRNLIDSIERAL